MTSLERMLAEDPELEPPFSVTAFDPLQIHRSPFNPEVEMGNRFIFVRAMGFLGVIEDFETSETYFVDMDADCFEELPKNPPSPPEDTDPTFNVWYRG